MAAVVVTMTQPLLDELVVLAVAEQQAALAVLAIHLLPRQAKVITEALEVLLQTIVVAVVEAQEHQGQTAVPMQEVMAGLVLHHQFPVQVLPMLAVVAVELTMAHQQPLELAGQVAVAMEAMATLRP